jgi:ligand-binding SRPBCC domain-containing protein
MQISRIGSEQVVPSSIEEVWAYFSSPQNLNDLTPPDLRFKIVSLSVPRMYAGQLIEYRIRVLPGIWYPWLTEIRHVQEKDFFVDEQRSGPYKFWYHEHRFVREKGGVRILDHVTYSVGFGFVGTLIDRLWVRRKLEGIFDYRRKRIQELFGKPVDKKKRTRS